MTRTLGFKLLLLLIGMCQGASAVAATLSGSPEADGWYHHGNSLANGNYVRGNGNYAFEMYTTQFTVTDSSVFDISGHDDASYDDYYETNHWSKATARTWSVGDTVLGIGGVFNDITAADAGWPSFSGATVNGAIDDEYRFRLQAKVGGADATWSTSTIAPGAGNGSGSTSAGGAAAFLVRTSGWHDLSTWENRAGQILGLQKTDHLSLSELGTDVARVIWTWDETHNRVSGWEILLNLTLIEDDLDAAAFTGALPGLLGNQILLSVQVASGAYTDALVVATVPEPATWAMALVGLLAIGGARVARRKRG
jgi:hypothetical protein